MGFVSNGNVYYSQGKGGKHVVKTLDEYKRWLVIGN